MYTDVSGMNKVYFCTNKIIYISRNISEMLCLYALKCLKVSWMIYVYFCINQILYISRKYYAVFFFSW